MPLFLPLIKPPALRSGATIGVTAPAKWPPAHELARAREVLESAGYSVVIGDTTIEQAGPFAGTPEERADELHRFFADPGIDAIFCARGGYSAFRLVDLLDAVLIRSHPKIFVGYSDLTHLLHAITGSTGLVTYHGPMLHTFRNGLEPESMSHMQGVFSGQLTATDLTGFTGAKVLREGSGVGPLWGGNLSILMSLMGTPRQMETAGRVLFIEDIHEPLHKLETMLQQLRAGGLLSDITGLIVGKFTDVPKEPIPFGYGTDEMVLEACAGLDIPIVTGVPCGHGDTILTFPMGLPARLSCATAVARLEFLEAPVATG